MTRELRQIRSVARSVRKLAEKYAPKAHISSLLEGLCIDSSKEIFVRLKAKGLAPEIYRNGTHDHWFVICCGHIIDVTATQFNHARPGITFEPIEIRPIFSELEWIWQNHTRDLWYETHTNNCYGYGYK